MPSEVEMLSRVAICAWNTRCWTYSEARLSQNKLYVCRDGLISFQRGRLADDTMSRYGYDGFMNVHHDLQMMVPPSEGGIDNHTDVRHLVSQSPADKANAFINAWNGLACRTTTKWEDTLGILANLLQWSTAEVLALSSQDQMRALVATQDVLPLSILTVNVKRQSSVRSSLSTTRVTDSWLPVFPQGQALRQREFG